MCVRAGGLLCQTDDKETQREHRQTRFLAPVRGEETGHRYQLLCVPRIRTRGLGREEIYRLLRTNAPNGAADDKDHPYDGSGRALQKQSCEAHPHDYSTGTCNAHILFHDFSPAQLLSVAIMLPHAHAADEAAKAAGVASSCTGSHVRPPSGSPSPSSPSPLPAEQRPDEIILTSKEIRVRGRLVNSLVQLPNACHRQPESGWPVIVWLHGLFECGSSRKSLQRVKQAPGCVPRIFDQKLPPAQSFVVVSPQCAARAWWDSSIIVSVLHEVVEQLTSQHNVTIALDRVYLMGVSMGAYGVYNTLSRYPHVFAAGVPVCGAASPWTSPMLSAALAMWSRSIGEKVEAMDQSERAIEVMATVPLWAFHGAWDPVVPVSSAKRTINLLRAVGSTACKITIYRGVGHQAWFRAFRDAGLYDWLLAQHKDPSQGAVASGDVSIGITPSTATVVDAHTPPSAPL